MERRVKHGVGRVHLMRRDANSPISMLVLVSLNLRGNFEFPVPVRPGLSGLQWDPRKNGQFRLSLRIFRAEPSREEKGRVTAIEPGHSDGSCDTGTILDGGKTERRDQAISSTNVSGKVTSDDRTQRKDCNASTCRVQRITLNCYATMGMVRKESEERLTQRKDCNASTCRVQRITLNCYATMGMVRKDSEERFTTYHIKLLRYDGDGPKDSEERLCIMRISDYLEKAVSGTLVPALSRYHHRLTNSCLPKDGLPLMDGSAVTSPGCRELDVSLTRCVDVFASDG
ncbi:hypothetical protein J6590_101119 [Homalodisca vitripennis]|nr:hypothetical protein J6590_101119 [Homalodisca vitripennis]